MRMLHKMLQARWLRCYRYTVLLFRFFLFMESILRKSKTLLFALPVLTCFAVSPAYAVEKDQAPAALAAQKTPAQDALRKMVESNRPSEKTGHSVLMSLAGTWDYSAKFWASKDVEPQPTMGAVKNEMIMDGRFLSSDTLGSLRVDGHTVPVLGRGLIGYDMAKKAYTSVWVDSISSGMMVGAGNYDEKEKTISETGKFTDPVDGVEKNFRSELRFTDAQSYKRTIFTTDKAGKEVKLMEIELTKKM